MSDPHRFDGRVALVTGAARGIGAAVAAALAARGATVALADVLPIPDDAPGDGHRIDVRSASSCRDVVDAVLRRHGRIDHLVNSAAVIRRAPAATMTERDFTDVVDVNLTGTFRMCQAVHPALATTRGSIVNLSSTNGRIAVRDKVGYAVSKAAVQHLTRILALEWAADGIRVNAVAPTMVATEINADARADPAFLADRLAAIPLGRPATLDEVSDAVLHLLGTAATMTTGHTLYVDGGAVL